MWPRKLYMRRRENLAAGFLRSAMELHYYRPAFYKWLQAVSENPDLLYEQPLTQSAVVLDVGAYTGEWCSQIHERYRPTIYAFEPDPRNFRVLQTHFAESSDVTPLEYGLGACNEKLPIAMHYMGSSTYPGPADKETSDWADVSILDIARVWEELGLKYVDLMKINIEGGEFALLERMLEAKLTQKVECFLIQFHEWHPKAYGRRKNIRQLLSETHQLEWDFHFIWEKWVRRT